MVRLWPTSLITCVLAVVLTACGGNEDLTALEQQVDHNLAAPFTEAQVRLTNGDATVELDAFVADTPKLRRQGLQGWPSLPERTGMVFAYAADSTGGFWMKDTLIPLSIAFADAEGRIHTIRQMEPCEAQPCPSYAPNAPYRHALEVNQGLFDELGVAPGWRLEVRTAEATCRCGG